MSVPGKPVLAPIMFPYPRPAEVPHAIGTSPACFGREHGRNKGEFKFIRPRLGIMPASLCLGWGGRLSGGPKGRRGCPKDLAMRLVMGPPDLWHRSRVPSAAGAAFHRLRPAADRPAHSRYPMAVPAARDRARRRI